MINYIRLKEVKSSVRKSGEELLAKSSELLSVVASQEDKLATNNSEMKEVLQSHRDDIADQLDNLRSSVDTYALSASIGTDAGTLEAGISLKSLTAQLRELVQLQLAREREKMEGYDKSDNSDIRDQINNLKEENREHFTELFVGLHSLTTKLELLQKGKVNNESLHKDTVKLEDVDKDVDSAKYAKETEHAQYWSKIQTVASVVSMTATLILIVHELNVR